MVNVGDNVMHLCYIKDASFGSNITLENEFLLRQDGDITIMYEVMRSYETHYWAQVSISNHNTLRRLDNWKQSWEWTRDEFIYAMKGAYPYVVDTSDCIFGRQGQFYKEIDFSAALNCERRPTIIDSPQTRANDTNLGRIPFCCRNGTILPPNMDPRKSKTNFQIQVYKMPPDLNKSELIPHQKCKIISGTPNPDYQYQCGPPVRVSPSTFPDSSGLPTESRSIASWQVVCNITPSRQTSPRCCVSFSAFFNDSAIPCSTRACGCNNRPSQTCSATEPALLLPPYALFIPFENRTVEAVEWAEIKSRNVPNTLPCGDNCGVSINWHLLSAYRGGWTARITLLNWGDTDFAHWFAAVQLDNGGPGFEQVYSFSGITLDGSHNTIFLQGLSEFNNLAAEKDGANPRKDPRVPGNQQSVILFTKKTNS